MSVVSILIVEDELIIARNIAKKLKKIGYSIEGIVSSGEAALKQVSQQKPDLILMDIAIKGAMDGIETAVRIKEEIADIPVVFLTAYASDKTVGRASKSGCYGYLIKPFREAELQATIKISLNKHQEQSIIRKSLQDTINEYSSHFDKIYLNELTDLPNKLFLRDSFDYLKSLLSKPQNHSIDNNNLSEIAINLIAIFRIDLDRFAKLNSCLNQQQKNVLVREIAKRLNQFVSNCNFPGITIYLQEDCFLTMIPIDKEARASQYGRDILAVIKQTIDIETQEIFPSASIGISIYPKDGQKLEELLEQAKKASKYAQRQGGDRYQFFTFAFNIKNSQAREDLALETELHYALEREELELYYQPKIDISSNLITGAEALLRWNHPTLGKITADRFINLAEESGLIKPIGKWVLEKACEQTQIWHQAGLDFLTIGINISGLQFQQSDLFHTIAQILFKTSLDPQYLQLELTEKILVENIRTNIQKLNLIKKLGIKIALDDFGTGYASLGYLQQFPFDVLKIDSCFVRHIDKNKVNDVIVENIIRMAHQLGLKVAAEGVETEKEFKYLQKHRCNIAQGFYHSLPLASTKFKDLVVNTNNISLAAIDR